MVRISASIPEVAAGRGEKKTNPNNCQGAKQGLTAAGRICQSPRLRKLQQESARVSSGFLCFCSTQGCLNGGLGLFISEEEDTIQRMTQSRE